MKHILVDYPVHTEGMKRLADINGVRVSTVEPSDTPRSLPEPLIGNVHVLLCEIPPINISAMPSLELIQLASSGYSQLFNLGLTERGIRARRA